jgi:hypothetical protein
MLVQLENDPISEQWQLSTTFGDLERLIVATAGVELSPATARELGTLLPCVSRPGTRFWPRA